jgi:E3 ubiquitin-protein ligase DOA10
MLHSHAHTLTHSNTRTHTNTHTSPRLMLLRNDNEWAIKFQKVINDGVGNLDALYIYTHIIGPVTIYLLDFTLLPYFFAKCICLFTTSYATQTMLVRQSFPLYLLLRLMIVIGRKLYQYIVTLHDEIRDSRYLLGKELTNR